MNFKKNIYNNCFFNKYKKKFENVKKVNKIILYDTACIYFIEGNFEKSKNILKAIDVSHMRKNKLYFNTLFLFFLIYYFENNISEEYIYYESIKSFYKTKKNNYFKERVDLVEQMINIFNKKANINFFIEKLKRTNILLFKVFYNFLIYCALMENGDLKNLEEHVKYIEQYGRTTFFYMRIQKEYYSF